MKINEIFGSIDGEGIRTGELATFIRIAGCNLRCSYCDTEYALNCNSGTEMDIESIIQEVLKIGYKNVTITGGEPLMHNGTLDLVEKLVSKGFNVNIETNGSYDIENYLFSDSVVITMDWKTKSSGEFENNVPKNIALLKENDVLKFVVSRDDLQDVSEVIRKYEPKCYIYISPIFGEIEPYEIVEHMKQMFLDGIDMSKVRVQVQLHKVIWSSEIRGV